CVLVSQVLEGHGIKFAWDLTRSILSEKPYAKIPHMDEILSIDISRPGEDIIWPDMGSVKTSLRAALWASLTASDFRDGITKVIELGGDTDTYGAIAGGILGAHFGINGIPQEWRDVLIGREIMIKLAGDLYALAHA
ncbi:ADP-ribosylglycohydrolase family protein, partial [Candidatus Kaiserbacteria bacterium]|nr:ADP-ribosylglycohydrolase family protein [Candidatus Kaiserbacteria bacterium]